MGDSAKRTAFLRKHVSNTANALRILLPAIFALLLCAHAGGQNGVIPAAPPPNPNLQLPAVAVPTAPAPFTFPLSANDPLAGHIIQAKAETIPLKFRDKITVHIEPEDDARKRAWKLWHEKPGSPRQEDLQLYLNGITIPLLPGTDWKELEEGTYEFRFSRRGQDVVSTQAWQAVMASLDKWGEGEVRVTIGFKGYWPAPSGSIYPVNFFGGTGPIFFALYVVLAMGLFALILWKCQWVRDAGWRPRLNVGDISIIWERVSGMGYSLSLSRVQFALWATLVPLGCIYVSLVTHWMEFPSKDIIILLGVVTGTVVGGTVLDKSKRDQLKAEIELRLKPFLSPVVATPALQASLPAEIADAERKLLPQQRQNWLLDLITDDKLISVLRLQMVAWTIILAVTYAVTICRFLAPPNFDGHLLALMGVSSGGYLAAKVQES